MVENRELRKLIEYKVGKFSGEALTEEDLLAVKDLGISGKRLDGEDAFLDVEELKKLSNLEVLSINQMDLDNKLVEFLNALPKLKSLMLTKCDIKEHTLVGFSNVNSLIINGCQLGDHVQIALPEDTTIAEEEIDLENVSGQRRLKRLVLKGCKVPTLRPLLRYEALEKISMEGTTVEDNSIEELKDKIEVFEKEEANPIR